MSEEPTGAAVAVREPTEIIRAASSEDVGLALAEYQRIQSALDKSLPDCIMRIQGKSFRKKSYWRAVATAFNLQVEEVQGSEKETKHDAPSTGIHPLDWTICVTYRASASNGRMASGDGACSASEKWVHDKETGEFLHARGATYHNVRSHAHTRAYNRAVSNLVGFGEVSAEEVYEAPVPKQPRPPLPDMTPPEREVTTSNGPEWLDESLGFGQHKAKTWRHFLDGAKDGQAQGYLEWLVDQDADTPRQKENRRRASSVLDMRAATQ